MTDVVGSAKFELRASRDKLKQDIAAAERDLQVGVSNAEKNVTAGAKGMGGALAGIGATAAAVATTVLAVVAAVGLAAKAGFDLSFAALRYADDIADSARRIDIGTSALQEFRFVAQKTGEDAAAADRSLESFAQKLGEAQSGLSKESVKSFAALGFSQDDLRQIGSVEQAIDTVIDRIGELGSEADRAAIAEKLGLGAFSAALREGADEVATLRDEAQALGIVIDEDLIKRASKAQDEFDTLSKVIDIQLKEAFLDLAPALLGAIELVARLAEGVARLADSWRAVDDRTNRGLAAQSRQLQSRVTELQAGAQRYPTLTRSPAFMRDLESKQAELAAINAEIGQRARDSITGSQAASAPYEDPGGRRLINTDTPARTPRARVDRSAEREARRAERVEQDIFRAKQRLLQVAEGDLLTAQERADLLKDQVFMERQARDAEIASKVARDEITAIELGQLNLANEQADILEDRIMRENAIRDVMDEELANRSALADLTANLVSLQIGAARTAQERQRLELELLAITQRQRRERLDQELNNTPGLSDAERQQRYDLNGQIEQLERDAVARANLSPLQQWRDEALKTGAEISEAYEAIAANGLDALNEGIVDAIMGTKSLGEVFSQVAKQILADLLSISVRRGITEPLANLLFGGSGGGGGGGGGFLSSIGSALFGGMGGGNSGGGQGFSLPNVIGSLFGKGAGAAGPKPASFTFAPTLNAQGAGPREVDALKGEIEKMRQDFPSMAVGAVNEAAVRGGVVYGRPG